MNRKTSVAMAIYSCLAFLAFGIYTPRATAGQSVEGAYKITGTTDLGDQVRITMQITLINASQDKIFVTEARLRISHGSSEYEPASLILQPNSNAQVVTQDFTISKVEYQLWNKTRPRLGLKVQIGGVSTTLTVPLMPQPDGHR